MAEFSLRKIPQQIIANALCFMLKKLEMEVNLAFYRKKDWGKFLRMIDDRESMFDTWKEWNKSYLRTKKELTSNGLKVNEVEVDLAELYK
ncbi:hypothetical protein, partial [Croceivirga sp. JEA036]|uniref:hypothetical protein n=1 Tax=Croceivirga sp. JEA036 TaxID=2721162 RepID=UPI00143A54C0